MGMLVNMMEGNPAIARGFFKGSKEEAARFWEKVNVELNAAGPPIKTIVEWKKVWADQKKYVRQKVANNIKMQKGTGGGPNMEKVLSPLEEAILKLIGIKQSVEGLAVKKFGIQENLDMSCEENCLEVESLNLTQTGALDGCMDISGVRPISPPVVDSLMFTNEDPSADKSEVASASKKPYSSQKASKKESSLYALEEEIKIQREISANIKTAVTNQDEQCENLKKIYQRLDKLYELKKTHLKAIETIKKEKLWEIKIANSIKREKLEENKRHNYVMEQMRRKEIEHKLEKNKRLLGIQELKTCKRQNN